MRVTRLLAITSAIAFSMLSSEALAAQRKGSTVAIPQGAQVSIEGSTARVKAPGVTGTFDCSCDKGAGTCTLLTSGSNIVCYKGENATCTTSCSMITTTGITGGRAAMGAARAAKGGLMAK